MKLKIHYPIRVLMITCLALFSAQAFSQTKKNKMKVNPPQAAPSFMINDVNGAMVNLDDYRGKKIMLTFYRNVGCPICNLRFHELQQEAEYFKSKNMIALAVYESSAASMRQYIDGETYYASLIPDESESLYKLYDVERSMGKVMRGMFHGGMGKMKAGKKLFRKKMKQDGNANRIGADFLIDENGKVHTAYYGDFVGDHLPMEEIKKFLGK